METKPANRQYTSIEKKTYTRDQLVTLSDLDQFRNDLLKGIKDLLNQRLSSPEKQWLKSSDVRKLLNISAGTLQHLRDAGHIQFSRIGGIIYYQYEDIKAMLEKG